MCNSASESNCGGKKMKKLFMGAIFLVVGVLFLLKNFNVLPGLEWNDVWPWVSVIIGLKMVLCSGKMGSCGEKSEKKETETKEEMKEEGCCGGGACGK